MTTPISKYDRIDQWLDWGDHTVTVDPIRNSAWIYEGQDSKHLDTVERGRRYDREDTLHLLSKLQDTQPDAYVNTYLPTSAEIKGGFERKVGNGAVNHHGVSAPFDQLYCHRGSAPPMHRGGERPIIDHLHRSGVFPEADTGTIERQVYGSRTHVQERVFSRTGVCDHGMQCT